MAQAKKSFSFGISSACNTFSLHKYSSTFSKHMALQRFSYSLTAKVGMKDTLPLSREEDPEKAGSFKLGAGPPEHRDGGPERSPPRSLRHSVAQEATARSRVRTERHQLLRHRGRDAPRTNLGFGLPGLWRREQPGRCQWR